jgi:hypothetical protein
MQLGIIFLAIIVSRVYNMLVHLAEGLLTADLMRQIDVFFSYEHCVGVYGIKLHLLANCLLLIRLRASLFVNLSTAYNLH